MIDWSSSWPLEDSPDGAPFRTKQELVAARLREAIVNGLFPPGQHLRQDDVARHFALSWTPVREAFRILETEGWLTIERHRGAVVATLSVEDFEDISLLRITNEPVAARLSAERMTSGTLGELERLAALMRPLDPRGLDDWRRRLQLEREFYAVQYQAAEHGRLFAIVMGLHDAAERYLRVSHVGTPDERVPPTMHEALLTADRARDGAAAAATTGSFLLGELERTRPLIGERLRRLPVE